MTENPLREELIRCHLSTTVPLLVQEYRAAGGPEDYHYDALRRELKQLGFGGTFSEALLYPTPNTAAEAARLSRAIALLAFCVGGVRFAGLHFCAIHAPYGRRQESQYCAECASSEVQP